MASNAAETVSLEINQQSLLNVNMSKVTKLDSTNYLMWSLQVYALLDDYALAGYLDGSTPQPATNITINNTQAVNPAYTMWKRQDKLIYSGLIGAISLSIQPHVSRSTTSSDIWKTLKATYAKPSRGHIKQLKHQLKQWTKEKTQLILLTMRFDQLALLGKTIDHEDQIEYVLEGLPEEYKSIVNQVEGRDTLPSLTELYEKLINREAKYPCCTQQSLLQVSQFRQTQPPFVLAIFKNSNNSDKIVGL